VTIVFTCTSFLFDVAGDGPPGSNARQCGVSRPALGYRRDLNAARSSPANSSGYSHMAK
jgi:hypothetical protein